MKRPNRMIQLMLLAAVVGVPVSMAKPAKKAVKKSSATSKAPAKTLSPQQMQQQGVENTGAAQSATSGAATGTQVVPANPSTETITVPTGPSTVVGPAPVTGSTEALTVAAPPSESGLLGSVQLRPGYYLKNTPTQNRFLGSENTLEFGYQLNRDTKFLADQYIDTLQDKSNPSQGFGSVVRVQQADLHAVFNNLAGDANGGIAFSYEPLFKVPVGTSWRDEGRILEVRNYFKLRHNYLPVHSITLMEVPMVFAINGSKYQTVNSTASAPITTVPVYENRVYLQFDGVITSGLTYAFPIYWRAVKERGIGGAPAGGWTHDLAIWPEIDYAINQNFTVGVAYRTETLSLNGGPARDFDDGFETGGVFQAVVKASL